MKAHTLGDVVDALRSMFGCLAKPCEHTKGHPHNVRVRYGQNDEEGKILVTFMTKDDLMLDIKVDIARLLDEGRDYLDDLMGRVADMVDDSLMRRQEKTRSIITSN